MNSIKKLYQSSGLLVTLWVLFWFPFAMGFAVGYSAIVGVINISFEDAVSTFKDIT